MVRGEEFDILIEKKLIKKKSLHEYNKISKATE